jgi:hypothetical protein
MDGWQLAVYMNKANALEDVHTAVGLPNMAIQHFNKQVNEENRL